MNQGFWLYDFEPRLRVQGLVQKGLSITHRRLHEKTKNGIYVLVKNVSVSIDYSQLDSFGFKFLINKPRKIDVESWDGVLDREFFQVQINIL